MQCPKKKRKPIPPTVVDGYEIKKPSRNCYKLLAMKRQRGVKWLGGLHAHATNLANGKIYRSEGYLINAVGNLMTGDKMCQCCKKDMGPMEGCVVVAGIGNDGCGNCVFRMRRAPPYLCFHSKNWLLTPDEERHQLYGERGFQLSQLAKRTSHEDEKEEEAATSPQIPPVHPASLPPESDLAYRSGSPAAAAFQPAPEAQSPELPRSFPPAAKPKTPTPEPHSPPPIQAPTPPISEQSDSLKEELSDEFGDGESPVYTDVWMCYREGMEINCVCCYPGVWEV